MAFYTVSLTDGRNLGFEAENVKVENGEYIFADSSGQIVGRYKHSLVAGYNVANTSRQGQSEVSWIEGDSDE